GDRTLTIEGLSGSITIDSSRKLAYNGTTSLSHLVQGDWPTLSVDGTAISWTGSVSRVTITPNWRWL
ncbi:MAG: phage tail protein, partial [Clostridia bacterium]|nr:phage tail protein [Clostridia bacterium]